MIGLDDNKRSSHSGVVQFVGDLIRHSFLKLESPSILFDKAREFRNADDPTVGPVSDVDSAEEGKKMMFAQAVEWDVPVHYEIAVFAK